MNQTPPTLSSSQATAKETDLKSTGVSFREKEREREEEEERELRRDKKDKENSHVFMQNRLLKRDF